MPFALYLTLALTTPLQRQIKQFWAPFAVITLVTFYLFSRSQVTHDLVADELAQFGAGGGNLVVAERGGQLLLGKLILVTKRAVYLKDAVDQKAGSCAVRLPLEGTTLISSPSRNIQFRERKIPFFGDRQFTPPQKLDENDVDKQNRYKDRTEATVRTQALCSLLIIEQWPGAGDAPTQESPASAAHR